MTFIKQKQRTGNITETTCDSGTTTCDLVSGVRTFCDKDLGMGTVTGNRQSASYTTWVKLKQRTGTFIKEKQA